jgi:putative transcriptional regulator
LKITRKHIDAFGLLALAVLFLWFPYKLQQPGVADRKILVATDKIHDGVFDKTVILISKHNGHGAFGLVLNAPPRKPGKPGWGGPLGDEIFTIHSLDVSTPATVKLPDLQIGYTKGALPGKPKEYIVVKGWAGWDRAQLPREIDYGAWKIIDFNRDLVFHTKTKEMWDKAMKMPERKQIY